MPSLNMDLLGAENALFAEISRMLDLLRSRVQLVDDAIRSLERYEEVRALKHNLRK